MKVNVKRVPQRTTEAMENGVDKEPAINMHAELLISVSDRNAARKGKVSPKPHPKQTLITICLLLKPRLSNGLITMHMSLSKPMVSAEILDIMIDNRHITAIVLQNVLLVQTRETYAMSPSFTWCMATMLVV